MPEVHEFMNAETPAGKKLSLGLYDEGRLYVNGEPVITEQKVKLQLSV